jgi:hypothetical protein
VCRGDPSTVTERSMQMNARSIPINVGKEDSKAIDPYYEDHGTGTPVGEANNEDLC